MMGFGRDDFKPGWLLQRELARGEAFGLPSDPEQYQRSIDPANNAAATYQEAISLWNELTVGQETFVDSFLKNPTPENDIEAAEQELARYRKVFDLLDAASQKPDLCFDRRYFNAAREPFTQLAPLRQFVRLRILRSRLHVFRGDFAGAYRELQRAASIARHLRLDNQSSIVILVQISIRRLIFRALESTLCVHGRNHNAPMNADQVISALGAFPRFRDAIRGDYAFALGGMSLLRDAEYRAKVLTEIPKVDQFLSRTPKARIQDFFANCFFSTPLYQDLLASELIRYHVELFRLAPPRADAFVELLLLPGLARPQYRVSSYFTGFRLGRIHRITAQIPKALATAFAKENLVRILAHSLALAEGFEIPPDFPLDPFSGKPFRAKETADGFQIWSVGPNLRAPTRDCVVQFPYVDKTLHNSP
jgi:hypothetical protein